MYTHYTQIAYLSIDCCLLKVCYRKLSGFDETSVSVTLDTNVLFNEATAKAVIIKQRQKNLMLC